MWIKYSDLDCLYLNNEDFTGLFNPPGVGPMPFSSRLCLASLGWYKEFQVLGLKKRT